MEGTPSKVKMASSQEKQMCMAARKGDSEAVARCIAAGADVNEEMFGDNALIRACKEGHVGIVKQLILAGCDVNWADEYGSTPLIKTITHWHQFHTHSEVVKVLLAAGADANKPDNRGATALMWGSDRPSRQRARNNTGKELNLEVNRSTSTHHTPCWHVTALHLLTHRPSPAPPCSRTPTLTRVGVGDAACIECVCKPQR